VLQRLDKQVPLDPSEAERDCATAHAAVAAGHLGCLIQLLQQSTVSAGGLNAALQLPLHAVDHSDSSLCHSMTAQLCAGMRRGRVLDSIDHIDSSGQTALQRTVWQHPAAADDDTAAATAAATIAGAATAAGAAGAAAAAAAGSAAVTQRICVRCADQLLKAGAEAESEVGEQLLDLLLAELPADGLHNTITTDFAALIKLLTVASDADLSKCLLNAVLRMSSNAESEVQLLLQCGADTVQENDSEQTLLHLTAQGPACGRYSSEQLVSCCGVLRVLVQHSKRLLTNTDSFHSTALHVAYKYAALMTALLELGVEVDATNDGGCTALVSSSH
jgi:hypothetical protein